MNTDTLFTNDDMDFTSDDLDVNFSHSASPNVVGNPAPSHNSNWAAADSMHDSSSYRGRPPMGMPRNTGVRKPGPGSNPFNKWQSAQGGIDSCDVHSDCSPPSSSNEHQPPPPFPRQNKKRKNGGIRGAPRCLTGANRMPLTGANRQPLPMRGRGNRGGPRPRLLGPRQRFPPPQQWGPRAPMPTDVPYPSPLQENISTAWPGGSDEFQPPVRLTGPRGMMNRPMMRPRAPNDPRLRPRIMVPPPPPDEHFPDDNMGFEEIPPSSFSPAALVDNAMGDGPRQSRWDPAAKNPILYTEANDAELVRDFLTKNPGATKRTVNAYMKRIKMADIVNKSSKPAADTRLVDMFLSAARSMPSPAVELSKPLSVPPRKDNAAVIKDFLTSHPNASNDELCDFIQRIGRIDEMIASRKLTQVNVAGAGPSRNLEIASSETRHDLSSSRSYRDSSSSRDRIEKLEKSYRGKEATEMEPRRSRRSGDALNIDPVPKIDKSLLAGLANKVLKSGSLKKKLSGIHRAEQKR